MQFVASDAWAAGRLDVTNWKQYLEANTSTFSRFDRE
jgi:hypothetical protein